jgi:hypothetical protein
MRSRSHRRFVLGLDLGQAQDYTALAVVQWQLVPWPAPGTLLPHPHYNVPTLKRWPAGTPYRDIVNTLANFMRAAPLSASCPTLVIDETGVGRPVAQMIYDGLVRAGVEGGCCAVTISDGHEVKHTGDSLWQVPKKTLVSVLQVLLQNRRLHVSAGLPDAQMLVKELQAFRAKITPVRNDTLESWREREYDDLVLAVALACWWAEMQQDWFDDRARANDEPLVLVA